MLNLKENLSAVIEALERKEVVRLTHKGKLKGIIQPPARRLSSGPKDHPFFRMRVSDERSVEEVMRGLRGGRYGDL